jgi:hypothetical protein
MSLSAVRILKWRGQMTPSARTPLLDTLWKDGELPVKLEGVGKRLNCASVTGIMYFTWMIGTPYSNLHASSLFDLPLY